MKKYLTYEEKLDYKSASYTIEYHKEIKKFSFEEALRVSKTKWKSFEEFAIAWNKDKLPMLEEFFTEVEGRWDSIESLTEKELEDIYSTQNKRYD